MASTILWLLYHLNASGDWGYKYFLFWFHIINDFNFFVMQNPFSHLMNDFNFFLMLNSFSHPFHLIGPSPWPVLGAGGSFFITVGGVLYFHYGLNSIVCLGVLLIVITMFV